MWLLLVVLGGCARPCAGASCGDLYPATALRLLEPVPVGEVDPLEVDPLLTGDADEGTDWALALEAGAIRLGVPGTDRVRWYDAGRTRGGVVGELRWATAGDRFGAAVARWERAGGRVDLLVGAPLASSGPATDGAGAVLVYEGLGDGVEGEVSGASPDGRVDGEAAEDRFGDRVTACADLDGDDEADWIAAAPWGGGLAGAIGLWRTGGGGLLRRAGTAPGDGFGAAAWCAGSLDEDELGDLVLGVPGADVTASGAIAAAGAVAIWRGGATVGEGDPALVLPGTESAEEFGAAVAVGDLDGDAFPDLVVGAPGHTSADAEANDRAGAAYVFRGRRLWRYVAGLGLGELAPDAVVLGVHPRERLGAAVAVADLDGDGLGELVLGAPGLNPTGADDAVQAGAIYVLDWNGTDMGDLAGATTTVTGARQYLRTGERLAAGDLDGDGVDSLAWTNHAEPPTP